MQPFQAVRGVRDLLPLVALQYQRLERIAQAVCARYGFAEIRIPTFESVDLFARSLGATTDIVEKEMYTWEDRGGRRLALRPEGTAGVARAFIQHHLHHDQPWVKLYYGGPMFRAERPQAGRFREFWQMGVESLGNASPVADAEVMLLLDQVLTEAGLKERRLALNSLGCSVCRPRFREALLAVLTARRSQLCDDCQRRIDTNPLRALDCKRDGPQLTEVPESIAFLCEACAEHFQAVQKLLKVGGCSCVVAPRLVRGLDYYTRTVFEVTTDRLGAQDAVAAGGRYDQLVHELGGPPTPAVGFALGIDRTVEALGQSGERPATMEEHRDPVFVAVASALGAGPSTLRPLAGSGLEVGQAAFEILLELRRAGITCHGGLFEKTLKAQLRQADNLKSRWCIILGADELNRGIVTVRDLISHTQETVPRPELTSWCLHHLH